MSKTVVVLSNDPQFIYLMQTYILKSGCRMQTDTASSVDPAQHAHDNRPVMILLDADCRGSDQLSVAGIWGSDDASSTPPIVTCSWDDAGSMASRRNFHLKKPVIFSDFQRVLAQTEVTYRANEEAPI